MSAGAPALARRAVEAMWLGDAARDAAMLLVSELVSNAVRHSGAGAADSISVHLEVSGGALRMSVTDPGPGFAPDAGRREPGIGGGFGLFLVDRLADAWGVETDVGTTVWLELGLAHP